MITALDVGNAGSGASRRTLYRQSKRVLTRLLTRRWSGPRWTLEPAVRRFLRARPRSFLARVLGDRGFALAAVVSLAAAPAAGALPPIELSDVAAGTGGFVINGIDADDYSGVSVSGAGDVNGDGLADVIVGANFADPGGNNNAGESYVVFGKAGTAAVNLSDVAAGTGGFVINGFDQYDYSGFSVSGAGDVNGDTLADLIVGAPNASPGGNLRAGESYVVFGKAGTAAVNLSDVAAGTGGFVIIGIDAGDASGRSVSGAGDVNGDGLADIIVGARFATPGGNFQAGESYVVFGKADTAPVNLSDIVAGTGGFVINGIDQNDQSGVSVSDAGDVNGDGLADLIVGAPGGNSNAGESYVVFSPVARVLVVPLDIEPGECPNEFRPRLGNSGRKIDIALVGTQDFDVRDVDVSTILLSRADGVGGAVLPGRVRVKDRATPFDGEPCGCHELKKDGIDDLRMRFFAVDMTVVLELDTLPEGASVELVIRGNLLDGAAFTASDCIVIDDPPDDESSDDSSDDDSESDSDSDDNSDDDSDDDSDS